MVLYDNRPFVIVSGTCFFRFFVRNVLDVVFTFCHVLPWISSEFCHMLPSFAKTFCKNSARTSLDLELKRDEARWDGPAANQRWEFAIYGMPRKTVDWEIPYDPLSMKVFFAEKLLGGISKHVWWHVSEAFSPDSWWFFWSSNVINTAEEFPDAPGAKLAWRATRRIWIFHRIPSVNAVTPSLCGPANFLNPLPNHDCLGMFIGGKGLCLTIV